MEYAGTKESPVEAFEMMSEYPTGNDDSGGQLQKRRKSSNQNGQTVDDTGSEILAALPEASDEDDLDLKSPHTKVDILYGVNDIPPWYLCIFLGLQHYLTALGATLSIPLILAPALCIPDNNVATAELIGTIFFVSGLGTVLQTTLGTRLPILQGGTFSFLAPTFAILSLPKWKCPTYPDNVNGTGWNITDEELQKNQTETWQLRMREVQGAIILASLFQVVIGFIGVMGLMLRYIGPLTIAPTISLIGISLFEAAADKCEGQWGIAIMTIGLIMIFSQYLRNVDLPCSAVGKNPDGKTICYKTDKSFPFFKLFPVILAIVISWLMCLIFTVSDVFSSEPGGSGYEARTDTSLNIIDQAAWFRFPYPFQWGLPTYSVAGVFGMVSGVLAGMLESLGDYYACARLSGAAPPPVHAINRGIMIEGIGCVLAGMWGTGNGMTSYSENVGAIGITKVGSRMVILTGGLFMIVLGMIGKFGALFVTIPDPVIGGVFMVTFGMITAVGISNLQFVDLNSSRNICILGFSFFFGLSLPQWMLRNEGAIQTGSDIADQIITVLLSTSMFVGGAVGFFLDNTVPGTDDERGLKQWRKQMDTEEPMATDDVTGQDAEPKYVPTTYDLPLCGEALHKQKWARYLPICPPFNFSPNCPSSDCCRKKYEVND